MDSLKFVGSADSLPTFSEAEWEAALYYFDRNQLTLMLPRAGMPDHVLKRLDRDVANNRERVRRLTKAFLEIDEAVKTPFLVLKGFANWEQFTADPMSRVQYDLDLFCPGTASE